MKCPYFNILFVLIPSLSSFRIQLFDPLCQQSAFNDCVYSHAGNEMFPCWEQSIPTPGSFPKPMVLASNIIGFSVQYHRF